MLHKRGNIPLKCCICKYKLILYLLMKWGMNKLYNMVSYVTVLMLSVNVNFHCLHLRWRFNDICDLKLQLYNVAFQCYACYRHINFVNQKQFSSFLYGTWWKSICRRMTQVLLCLCCVLSVTLSKCKTRSVYQHPLWSHYINLNKEYRN